MRKLTVAVCCMAALLCGCSASGDSGAVNRVIAATATPFAIGGSAAVGGIDQPIGMSITRNADNLVVEVTSPEQVQGLQLTFDEGTVQVSYRALMMNLVDSDIPELSVFAALRDGLSALPPTPEQAVRSGDELIVTLSGTMPCKLVWSVDGTTLRRIELPTADVVITVDSFAPIILFSN